MSDLPLPDPLESRPLDIQHDTDPAQDHGNARRIPNFGHALIFFLLAAVCLVLASIIVFGAAHLHSQAGLEQHPGIALLAQGIGYVLTFAIAYVLFPLLWNKPFFQGVHWQGLVARRHWKQLIGFALLLNIVAQAGLYFVSTKKNAPIDQVLDNPHLIWFTAVFAIFAGPFMEELAFRGFLLPAFATAYDWIALERTPAGLERWLKTTGHSQPALIFSALISSIPFALLHASQIGDAWGVVGILYLVSLGLSFVRIRTQSLACSTLVHASYNALIFLLIFFSTSGFRHLEKLAR